MKKLYLVKKLKKYSKTEAGGATQKVKLSWWEGMVGAVPVFDNKEDALVYAEGKEELITRMEYV